MRGMPWSIQLWAIRASPRRILRRIAGTLARNPPARCRLANHDLDQSLVVADTASLLLALVGGWAEAEAFAHALAELFPLLRGHVVAALPHALAETGAAGTVPSMSAEQDAAQRQEAERLPEGDLAPAKERRQQPIPKV